MLDVQPTQTLLCLYLWPLFYSNAYPIQAFEKVEVLTSLSTSPLSPVAELSLANSFSNLSPASDTMAILISVNQDSTTFQFILPQLYQHLFLPPKFNMNPMYFAAQSLPKHTLQKYPEALMNEYPTSPQIHWCQPQRRI